MDVDSVFPRTVFRVVGIEIRDVVVVTWLLMVVLALVGFLATRRLKDQPGVLQNVAEAVVELIESLVGQFTHYPAGQFMPFIGTLAVYLVAASTVAIVPGIGAPTRDLNTALALAGLVFLSVHYFGWKVVGPKAYLRAYIEPFWPLLPFNILGEISRTLALALRLFGNMLSGDIVVAVLVLLAGLFVPVIMQLFGLLIGFIQAYVFTLLAMVYIGAALQPRKPTFNPGKT